jgi:putative spermidine/putrescine transport system substrate-binding protein
MRVWRRLTLGLVLVLCVALSAAVLAVGCGEESKDDGAQNGNGGEQKKVTIVFTAAGGVLQEAMTKAWIEPFMAAHPNIEVIQDEPNENAKIKAMVEAGNVTWDVVDNGNDFGIGETESLCEEIDPKVVPMDELQPDLFKTTGHRVPCFVYATVVGYRTDKFGDQKPTSFVDFFDLEKFPGKRGSLNWPAHGLIEMALIADGVAPDQLYPLDLDRAFKKLDTIKDQMVWWTTGAQSEQLLADGEVSMTTTFNGRVNNIKKAGAPAEIMWDQFFMLADYFVIPKGTKHLKEAMELVAWCTSAEHSAELSKYIAYGPPNVNAVQKVGPTVEANLPTAHAENAVPFDDIWWSENLSTVYDRWQKWIRE